MTDYQFNTQTGFLYDIKGSPLFVTVDGYGCLDFHAAGAKSIVSISTDADPFSFTSEKQIDEFAAMLKDLMAKASEE